MIADQEKPLNQLQLFISCRLLADLSTFFKSDAFCILFVKKENQCIRAQFGKTELILDNLNPNFSTSIIIDYFFEIQQHLRFEVHHYQSEKSSLLIGSCETALSALAGSKDQVLVSDLHNNSNQVSGKIIVRADQVKTINDDIKIKFSCTNLIDTRFWFWHATSPFLRFYRLTKDDPHPVLVYESEFHQSNKNPNFKMIETKAQKLCNGDYDMPLKVELWDHRDNGSHVYMGGFTLSVNEMKGKPNLSKQIANPKKSKKIQGNFVLQQFSLIEKPSFFDYIQGGIQLKLILAIDFTASNQNPENPSSLHYIHPDGKMNDYQKAILGIGEILINYDYEKLVPVFGFGCKQKIPGVMNPQTLHCFPLNGNPNNPEVENLDGIMNVYQETLKNVQFDGPTYFRPILDESMKLAKTCKQEGDDNYLILLILTDGVNLDLQALIDAIILIDSSNLPLSIIQVRIGTYQEPDFCGHCKQEDYEMYFSGYELKKSFVQFVSFKEFKNNPELLAKNVLEEISDQLIEYYMLTEQKPKPPKCNQNQNQLILKKST